MKKVLCLIVFAITLLGMKSPPPPPEHMDPELFKSIVTILDYCKETCHAEEIRGAIIDESIGQLICVCAESTPEPTPTPTRSPKFREGENIASNIADNPSLF